MSKTTTMGRMTPTLDNISINHGAGYCAGGLMEIILLHSMSH